MSEKFNLEPLLNLMLERNDEASRRLGQLIAAEQNEKKRLELLENYRKEYAESFLNASLNGISPALMMNYRHFLNRIDEAIAAQHQAVQRSEKNTQEGKKEWQTQHTKMKALDTLKTRFEEKSAHLENKREQKILDEFSSRKRKIFPR